MWGNIISPTSIKFQVEDSVRLQKIDWGYLFMLYAMLIIIRFILVFCFYPVVSRIGIGSSLKEAVFMGFGGFRGTVGIALALSLSSQILYHTDELGCKYSKLDPEECIYYRDETNRLFCFVGGISILTLMVNGLLSGPLLKLLGLAKSEKTRKRVVENYWKNLVEHILVDYVRLLSQERFKDVDFSLVRQHVPLIGAFTFNELMAAVDVYKKQTPPHLHSLPHLEHVIPYVLHVAEQRRRRSVFVEDGYTTSAFGTMSRLPVVLNKGTNPVTIEIGDSGERSEQTTRYRRQSQAMIFEKCDRKTIFDPKNVEEQDGRDFHMDEE